jgi:hypothetical protein
VADDFEQSHERPTTAHVVVHDQDIGHDRHPWNDVIV